MSFNPPGWANTTTPAFAGTQCGNVDQDTEYTTSGTTPTAIGFQTFSSWSDNSSFTPDISGEIWTCNLSGIYNLRINQSLSVVNDYTPPDSAIAVIPNTRFFLDISGNIEPLAVGDAILHANPGAQSSVTYTTVSPAEDVEMVVFTTPVGFLTDTTIAGGDWSLSLFADTDDETEANSAYISIYAVDADGVSNPILIQDGSADTFILNSTVPYNYNHTFSVPTYIAQDLTKRIQFRLYANLAVSSTVNFYFRNDTLSSVNTTISQDVILPTIDVVDVRITVQSGTSELDQIFTSSIPVTMEGTETLEYTTSVNALANLYAGDTVTFTLASTFGRVIVTSASQIGGATNKFQWNLLATGTFGHQTPVEAPMLMSAPEVPEIVVVPPVEF